MDENTTFEPAGPQTDPKLQAQLLAPRIEYVPGSLCASQVREVVALIGNMIAEAISREHEFKRDRSFKRSHMATAVARLDRARGALADAAFELGITEG